MDMEEKVESPLNNVEGDGLDAIEFSLPEGQEPDIGSPGSNSETGTSWKRKKNAGPVDDAPVEVIERATTFMGKSMKELTIITGDAITDAKVNKMKQQLSSELAKIEGLTIMDRVRATSKIASERNHTLIFYRFTPEERIEFVKSILECLASKFHECCLGEVLELLLYFLWTVVLMMHKG